MSQTMNGIHKTMKPKITKDFFLALFTCINILTGFEKGFWYDFWLTRKAM